MPRPIPSVSGRRAALLVLALALGAAGCDSRGTGIAPVTVPLSAVVVSPKADSTRVGRTITFTASAYDTLGVLVPDARFAWTSEDPAVFTVNAVGRVTPLSEGAARLFVEAGGRRDTAGVYVYADTGWVLQPNPSSGANLNGVCFRPGGRLGWVVGDAGTILRTTDGGAHWARTGSGTVFNLNAVWFTSDTDGWAVGNSSTVLRTTDGGASWVRLGQVNVGKALHDVWFTGATTGFAVGASGSVLRTTDGGAQWTETVLPTANTLRAVAFGSPDDGWAVGAGGVIAATHDGGDSWNVLPAVTAQTLTGVWPTGPASAYAAGLQGVTARTSAPGSDTWVLGTALGASNAIEGLCFPSATTGFAVGFNAGGIALRSLDGGASWKPQAARTGVRLLDVWFVDAVRGWAVGESGVIVHTGSGGTGF